MRTATAAALLCGAHVAAAAAASPYDLGRAAARRPRGHLTAPAAGLHGVLNAALRAGAGVRTAPCAAFTAAELNDVLRALLRRRSGELDAVYTARGDRRALRHRDAAGWEAEWAADGARAAPARVRDGKCAEAAMLYTHHVTHAERALLARTAFALPLLSPHDAAHARADAVYAAQLSCVTGHNNTGVAPACTGSAPCWPAEVHWTGTGYGKYPFWGTAGPNPYPGPGCEPGKGGAIETFWSQPKKSEKYIHASCDLSTFSTGLTPNVGIPCNHLFVGWSAWLYTPDESYCCMSGCGYQGCSSLQDQVLTSPQSDWMKRFTYQGVADGYAGDYHSGRVKNYTLHVPDFEASPVAYFWYLTDMDGTPVEQGEGPQVMPRAECGFGPAYIYHQYGNFTATSLAASTFDIPAVCKNTTNMCVFK